MIDSLLYDIGEYIRSNVSFPADSAGGAFSSDNVIIGGWLPADPVDCILIRENSGISDHGQSDLHEIPYQFLARGDSHGRSRDLLYALYNSSALSTALPDGRIYHYRNNFTLAPTEIRVVKWVWIQTPSDLGVSDGGYIHSMNALITAGNQ